MSKQPVGKRHFFFYIFVFVLSLLTLIDGWGEFWGREGTYIVQVGELDLHRGGHQVGVGLDDHRHHFGVEDGGITVEQNTSRFVLTLQPTEVFSFIYLFLQVLIIRVKKKQIIFVLASGAIL